MPLLLPRCCCNMESRYARIIPGEKALVKRYVTETGSVWLKVLVAPITADATIIARITGPEVVSALRRRARAGTLPMAEAASSIATYRTHQLREYSVIELSPAVLERAMDLADRHSLRGYDAVQLAAALTANDALVNTGQSSLTLLSSDLELNIAAAAEQLVVEDPNDH